MRHYDIFVCLAFHSLHALTCRVRGPVTCTALWLQCIVLKVALLINNGCQQEAWATERMHIISYKAISLRSPFSAIKLGYTNSKSPEAARGSLLKLSASIESQFFHIATRLCIKNVFSFGKKVLCQSGYFISLAGRREETEKQPVYTIYMQSSMNTKI